MMHRLQIRVLLATIGALAGFGVIYLFATPEGSSALVSLRGLLRPPAPRLAELAVPTAVPGRPAIVYWIAPDGLWSWQQQGAAAPLHERIEQLCNLVLDRLGLNLLVIQAMVGEDDVAYLFFSVSNWEPS